jgi:hypothetical protein
MLAYPAEKRLGCDAQQGEECTYNNIAGIKLLAFSAGAKKIQIVKSHHVRNSLMQEL